MSDRRSGLLRRGLRKVLRAGQRATNRGAKSPVGPPQVRFTRADGAPVDVPVEAHTTVLAAARSAGLDLDHYCGGMASCGTCRVEIAAGAEHLTRREGREEMVLGFDRARAGDRLACQARVEGPVEVHIPSRF